MLQGSFAGESGTNFKKDDDYEIKNLIETFLWLGRISGGGLFGRNRGREGQEQAIDNGRVKIASLAHAVRLPERYRDAAQRYYNLAVVNRFTRGRRSDHVAAVCLYAVCRTEKSSHMLIDFSDILQVNVFTIGATFLKLCRVLNLTLPHVDPSLYISRFAVALDFGDYTQRVAQDAVRIAQRMDRDWITSGRRPAGICGACLLIAARMNGFRRTAQEMIYVVKVAEVTIQKRLTEFNKTESAQLSVRDFRAVWLEGTADPPSFQNSRKTIRSTDDDDELDEDSEEEITTKRKATTENQRTSKRLKGKAVDPRPMEDIPEEEEEDEDVDIDNDPLKISDEEVNGPFEGNQKNISEADNGVPGAKPIYNEPSEMETEENLISQQIESTLNEEIKHVADIDVTLTAEATIKEGEDPDATQVNTQSFDPDATQVDSTLVDEEHPDIIPIKNAHYEALSTEEKLQLSAIAKAKIAREEQELLNPELQKDALEVAEDLEAWMADESVMKAAHDIGKINR